MCIIVVGRTTTRRWIEQFGDLPRSVKDRLVLENCERQYNTRDCLHIAKECKIPMIFDFHHYYCYSKLYPDIEQESILDLAPEIIESWGDRKVLMHISEQGEVIIVIILRQYQMIYLQLLENIIYQLI